MRRVIEGSIRAGETTTHTAERLLDVGAPRVELPRYVEELADAARFARGAGDPNLYEDAVKQFADQIKRLGQGATRGPGQYTVRSAGQDLVRRLRRAKSGEQIDRLVDRWVLERARHQARVVARNEAVEAYQDSARKSIEGHDWAVGVRWSLSPAHPRPDICDVLASQDLHGLGPGGYRQGSEPRRPHPNCLCFTVPIVDDAHFERQLAKEQGEPEPAKPWLSGKRETGDQWLRRQPQAVQEAIAGPTRAKLLRKGRSVLRDDKGQFKPVYELLKRPKPIIKTGPRIDARPIVAADRENQVQPFPPLPIRRTYDSASPRRTH